MNSRFLGEPVPAKGTCYPKIRNKHHHGKEALCRLQPNPSTHPPFPGRPAMLTTTCLGIGRLLWRPVSFCGHYITCSARVVARKMTSSRKRSRSPCSTAFPVEFFDSEKNVTNLYAIKIRNIFFSNQKGYP